ncbi:hypothetical protein LAZ67_2002722 [Cordylochernes scorpioides]|uniref:Uncharacterized protein n=1 Tax=Cordylochernes scorpioides TaxID=51811 RepID=A0ABY6K271_9ARAC|nr:hypothetical protein LAZ67_2002722 [Cordylochernes scorpioides]
MRKFCARWMSHLLNADQNQIRKSHSQQCLELFKRDPTDFVRGSIPMDETCFHHYTPETKQQSKQWTSAEWTKGGCQGLLVSLVVSDVKGPARPRPRTSLHLEVAPMPAPTRGRAQGGGRLIPKIQKKIATEQEPEDKGAIQARYSATSELELGPYIQQPYATDERKSG